MSSLPVESSDWLAGFRSRVALERAVFEIFIQWGLTESALELQRVLERHFGESINAAERPASAAASLRVPEEAKGQIAEAVRDAYLRTRDIPRRRSCQERLHNGLLTGFQDLTQQLVGCYEAYLVRAAETNPANRRAA